MDALLSAILADPRTWFGMLGAGVLWIWSTFAKRHSALEKRVATCETERANLRAGLTLAQDRLAIAEGSVATLTSLLKREIHLD